MRILRNDDRLGWIAMTKGEAGADGLFAKPSALNAGSLRARFPLQGIIKQHEKMAWYSRKYHNGRGILFAGGRLCAARPPHPGFDDREIGEGQNDAGVAEAWAL